MGISSLLHIDGARIKQTGEGAGRRVGMKSTTMSQRHAHNLYTAGYLNSENLLSSRSSAHGVSLDC